MNGSETVSTTPAGCGYFAGMALLRFRPVGMVWLAGFLLGQAAPAASGADAPASAGQPSALPDIRIRHGDDSRWASPDWDDADWTRIGLEDYPAAAGPFWVRIRIEQPGPMRHAPRPDRPEALDRLGRDVYRWTAETPEFSFDALFVRSVYSFELFFDGRRLAVSGVVGHDRESEVPGLLDHLVRIPDDLLGGTSHLLAIRMSTYHFNFSATHFSATPEPVNLARRLRHEALQPVFPLVAAVGSLLTAAISLVLMRLGERRRALALVAAVSVVLAVFYALIAVRWLYPYPYDWHYPRLLTITWVMTVACVLMVALLVEQFNAPRKAWWLAGLVTVLAAAWQVSPFYDLKVLWICRAMLFVALVLAGWACWRRRPGAWPALAGVGVALLIVRTERRAFLDPTFFLTIEALVLLVFATVGAQVQAGRRAAREARLTAARMEIELLKKNLQPHFLLNTLTAVAEVIEQDPKGAVKFIEDLATEFRSLALMSGERLVPLQDELELCRAHLKVISRRTGRGLGLETDGVAGDEPVPPALFLTLIENGLVHQQADDGATFRLAVRATDVDVTCVFESPGRTRELRARPQSGTGLRYVKARLEESFPGGWTLTQGPIAEGWRTVITWRSAAGGGGA